MDACPAPEDLEALLADQLAGDARDRIEAHVELCAGCRIALADLADDDRTVDTVADRPSSRKSAPKADDRIDRYRIRKVIGTGGMGVVLLAEDAELQRDVVIKLLRTTVEGAGEIRLQREAQAMAQVSHPNVVPIYDVGLHAGQVFLAMEYLGGGDLAKWLAKRTRTPREILDVFVAAGRGLAAAHRAGLVHRDFKPHNVLLGMRGEVKVTDFGLARTDAETASRERTPSAERVLDTQLTHEGSLVGTPAYMAPEQIQGGTVDARSDQFSFCVALFEALHGERPFRGKDTTEVLEATLAGTLPESTKVPRRIRRVIERGLAREPGDRFASMDALLAALAPRAYRWVAIAGVIGAAAVAGVVIATRSPAAVCEDDGQELARVWNADRRAAVEHAYAALGAPATASITAIDRYIETWSAQRRDTCQATRVRGDQTEAVMEQRMYCLQRISRELDVLVGELAHVDRATAAEGARPVMRLANPTSCTADVARDSWIASSDPTQRAEVEALEREVAETMKQLASSQIEDATAATAKLLARAEKIGNKALLADFHHMRATAAASQRPIDDTIKELELAAQLADESGMDHTRALVLIQLVGRLTAAGRLDDAERWAEFARAAVKRDPGNEALAGELELALGGLYQARGQADRAETAYRSALSRFDQAGAGGLDVASAHLALGQLYASKRELDRALEHFARARDLYQISHPDSVLVAFTLNFMARTELERRGFAKVIDYTTQALALLAKQNATSPGDRGLSGQIYENRALGLDGLGDPAGAVAAMTTAVERGSPIARALGQLGIVQANSGRHADAQATFARMLELATKTPGHEADAVNALVGLAVMLQKQDRLDDAFQHAARALAMVERIEPRSSLHADVLTRLGAIENRREHFAAAARALEQALALRLAATSPSTAWTKLELAKAVWGVGRDRDRARALAREAVTEGEAAKDGDTAGKARAFLVEHP